MKNWIMENAKFDMACAKAEEVLKRISCANGYMVSTKSIMRAVEEITKTRILYRKFDFSKLAEGSGYESQICNMGAAMSVQSEASTSGSYEKTAYILLNEKETPEMIRFSLVHELGHLMTECESESRSEGYKISTHIDMDITSIPKEVLEDPGMEYLVDEQAANIFSLLVLMPQEAFVRALKKNDKISDIAILFGVESEAVKSRMMLLGE